MTAHAGEYKEVGEHSSIVGGSANLHSHYENQCAGYSFRKLGIELTRDPALPLLGIYPKDSAS